jgi:CHASE2 domain-containing sensor protein
LRTRPELFRDRLVIAGADYAGSGDEARVPNRGIVPGVVLHALIVDTILARFPIRDAHRTTVMVVVGTACTLLCTAMLLTRRSYQGGVLTGLAAAGYCALALVLFRRTQVLVPVVVPLLVCGTGTAVAWGVRRFRPAFPTDTEPTLSRLSRPRAEDR